MYTGRVQRVELSELRPGTIFTYRLHTDSTTVDVIWQVGRVDIPTFPPVRPSPEVRQEALRRLAEASASL
jgi:hypothetical protein